MRISFLGGVGLQNKLQDCQGLLFGVSNQAFVLICALISLAKWGFWLCLQEPLAGLSSEVLSAV